MKVLVSDKLGENGVQMFEAEEGISVDVKTGLTPDELKAIIGNYDALVIRSATKVTKDIIDAADRLKVIGRAGIGLDNVDIPAATQRGIVVMNTPLGNVVTTAEHAISMMLALTRNIPQGTMSLKMGRWEKKSLQGREVFNKVLGLVGMGKIGSIVADRAKGLKMKVIVYDPHVAPDQIQKHGYECVSLKELYKRADYITVHVPKLKETIGLLNKSAFDQMKKGVMIINCARGGIVNESDLYDALKSGQVGGAALDVFENEPPEDLPLIQLDNVICTPHLGASTKEAQSNVASDVADQIIDYLKNDTICNAVNAPNVSGDLMKILGPYLKLADRMGALQAQLTDEPITDVHIEYIGSFKDMDVSPVTTAALKGLLEPVVKYAVNFVNAGTIAQSRGIKVSVTRNEYSEDYLNLIKMRVISGNKENIVSGTLFGKKDPKLVRVNDFRVELTPEGNLLIITNEDKPGAIGSMGVVLGTNNINIGAMHVGQAIAGKLNVIFIVTDRLVSQSVQEEILALPLVKSVMTAEL
ncbi:MAG: D-3-phosphoglycerate dehydrogenase [Candidatus Magnetoglobus multicellularis str. Araruama]|uniref:D-3-phosphoglycerate dehydrogenase n=1 Tax=Candidatus Magnetoglobus multicellularis str. Araruama TaxID=890399 RepID=A0A1V1PG13_9BACT|nr:MAG: D-3-phosphoglycerate dehydrogenase [Candidatus Magnetoglobus multicellularis str. Araruama]